MKPFSDSFWLPRLTVNAAKAIFCQWDQLEATRCIDSLIVLIARAQMDDGYLFTYNQSHFQGQPWVNVQIEHELYCYGHLIEAGVSRFEATGCKAPLDICVKGVHLACTWLSQRRH